MSHLQSQVPRCKMMCRRSYSCQHRQSAVFSVVLLTAFFSITTSIAFVQPRLPKSCTQRLSLRDLRDEGSISYPLVYSSLSSSKNEEEGRSRIPFFARALQKIIKKEDGATGDNQLLLSDYDDTAEEEEKTAYYESDKLKALAAKTRLEAQKMDLTLSLSKIEKLEQKLLSINIGTETNQHSDKRSDILSEALALMQKLNPQQSIEVENVNVSQLPLVETSNISSEKQPADVGKQIQDEQKLILSDEKRADAIEGFAKLPIQIRDMMAKSVGMKDGNNATAVVDKLMDENRLFEGESDEQFSMVAKADDFEDIFVDMNIMEVNSFVKSLLPEVTRKVGVKTECIDAFYADVLGREVFNPTGKPENVPGGFIIRGEGKVKPTDGKDYGDALIDALDKKISKSSLAGKIQAYYILDPTPPTGEDIMNEEDEQPLLLVTNADISPTTNLLVKAGVTFLGLASVAMFVLGSFSINEDMMNQMLESANGFDEFYELSIPLALAVLSTQLVHEAGHLIFALKDDIKIGLPTLVPGFQFGLTGSITPITASPKNIKALFDFSIAGPLFGMLASIILLYIGLEITAFMDLTGREQLPSIPVEMLRISALGGGAIEYLLGDGLLNSPNPATDLIKLHPYAIAGFGGLVTNALSLLPIGNTDGGRISIAFFGRSFARVVQGFFILILALAGVFGVDQTNVLLCYAIFCQLWQKEPEVPCRNEVDELDSGRGFIAIATAVLVLLILTPLP